MVLIEPEIPQNTGNIGRTCVGSWSKLHLVGPLGFSIDDKNLKRAGLDYWPDLDWTYYPQLSDWQRTLPENARLFYFSTKAEKSYFDVEFMEGDWLVFGRETKGLGENILKENWPRALRIPFPGKIRSFNLANAVSMVIGEGLRQCLHSPLKN